MKKFLLSFAIVGALALAVGAAIPAYAATDCTNNPKGPGCPCGEFLDDGTTPNPNYGNASICSEITDPKAEDSLNQTLRNIINTLIFAAGIIAVIMIVVSGIRFVSSRGNPDSTNKARQTLIYSIVGLIVAVAAFAIVNFVLNRL